MRDLNTNDNVVITTGYNLFMGGLAIAVEGAAMHITDHAAL